LVSWAALSVLAFVVTQFGNSWIQGGAAAILALTGLAMLGYAAAIEWRSYRSLVDLQGLREVLRASSTSLEALRAAGLDWLGRTGDADLEATAVSTSIRQAESAAELRSILRNRLESNLRDRARQIGRRAALDGAALVAICPSPAWDGVIAGARGLSVIRQVAALFGVQPGYAVTLRLLRQVAWTATGTVGASVLAQELATQTLQDVPVVKQIVGAVPEAGLTAMRLYRLADVTAAACSPLSGQVE